MHLQRGDRRAVRTAPRCRAAALTLAAALLAVAIPRPASGRADLFDELFKQGQASHASMKTLTASFVETTTSALLTRPLTARGTLAVQRPSRIALRYTDPDERVVLIDGDTMTTSWPSQSVRQSKDIAAAQKRIQKYFVDSSPDELRSHFTIAARAAEDRAGAYLITMVPKRRQIQQGLSRLELWVDGTTQLMTAMKMTFPNGDTKVMTFTDVKPNAQVDASRFDPGTP
jgi:outer membrane lipoprotein-sorting protein